MTVKINGCDIQGNPDRAEYKKNADGSYAVSVKDFIAVMPDGRTYKAYLHFPSTNLTADDDEGVIFLENKDIQPFNKIDERDNTIWELTIPN